MKHRLLCTQQRTSVLLVFISAVLALVTLSIPTKSAEAATAKIVNGTFSYAMKEIYDCSGHLRLKPPKMLHALLPMD